MEKQHEVRAAARRPTVADAAKEAGVSAATVDRVMNGRQRVRGETAPAHVRGGKPHRLSRRPEPETGLQPQRVVTEDGGLDAAVAVADGDGVLVPKGHHPCGAPCGNDMHCLNVMAGPLRKWRFKNHPDHDWSARRTPDAFLLAVRLGAQLRRRARPAWRRPGARA